MKTKILLSSTTTFLIPELVFLLARLFQFHGTEFMPCVYTWPRFVLFLSRMFKIPVIGIHWPFRWRTQSLAEEMDSETSFTLRWLRVLYLAFGAGYPNCRAEQLSDLFPKAYCLLHPEVLIGAAAESLTGFLKRKGLFVENHRRLRGWGSIIWNPRKLLDLIREYAGELMLDPRHLAMSAPEMSAPKVYADLKPKGLHLSVGFLGLSQDWGELAKVIKKNPPEFIVLEAFPWLGVLGVILARKQIRRDLGI